MSSVKLTHASGNSMAIAAPATNPASNLELKLPATIGTAGQVLKNSSTAGTLEFADAGAAITNYDEWWNTTTTSVSSGTNVMSSGWTRKAGVSAIGSAMTESSGVFTFPSTGIWLYEFHALYAGNINTHMGLNSQHSTDSGSNWSYNAVNESHVYVSNETTIVYTFVSQQSSFDVTNASTARIRFNTSSNTTSGSIYGNANYDQVGARFTRLGDT